MPNTLNPQFVGPWPYPEMWWCVCAINDCQAHLFGPFPTLELANQEANPPEGVGCEQPHFAMKGEPPTTFKGTVGYPAYLRPGMDIFKPMSDWITWYLSTRLDNH